MEDTLGSSVRQQRPDTLAGEDMEDGVMETELVGSQSPASEEDTQPVIRNWLRQRPTGKQ